jgi:signal transduction histidine kinase/ligand-binding sensor domain-containing protein
MSHQLRRLLWLIVLATWSHAARGDGAFAEYLVDAWTTEEGLPSSTISDIAQTPDGYLWASTYDGLVRFDGVRFVRVGPDESMEARRVLCLHIDGTGLLLGTDGAGLLRYDGHKFTTVLEVEAGSSFNVVRDIEQDAKGDLWLGTRGGLGHWRDGQVKWITTATGYTNAANSIWNLAFDRQGVLWITDWVSLKSFSNGVFATGVVPDRKPVRAVYPTQSGELWAGMLGRAVHKAPGGEWIDEAGDFGQSEVAAFCRTRSGELWLGTRKGLYQRRDGKWLRFNRGALNAAEIRALFEDREGNLWVGTGTGGLIRLKRRLVTTYAAAEGLTDSAILFVRVAGEKLWAGSADGQVFEREGNRFHSAVEGGGSLGAPAKTMVQARDGAVWIGTFGNGLVRRDPQIAPDRRSQSGADRFLPAIGTFARVDKVTSLLEDRAGTIWVGTFYSLYRFAGSNVLVKVPVGGREILGQVTALLEGSGGLWAAFEGVGVARITGEDATWLTRRDGLPNHFVRALHEDAEGNLWIGTTAGLCRWRDGKVDTWTTAHGLLSDAVLQIVEDAQGHLWLGTKEGIMRLQKDDLRQVAEGRKSLLNVYAYGQGEGMTSAECTGNSGSPSARTADGKLWFPTARGLVMVDPAQLSNTATTPPPVHIEEVRADGKLVARPHVSPALFSRSKPQASKAAIQELASVTRRIEFVYTAPALMNPERVRFRYRLEGFDTDWTDAGTARSAVYSKLGPGDYQFQVSASNSDGVWNEAGHTYAFRILAPFWRQTWFLGLAGLVTAGGLGGMVRFVSLRNLRRKLARLEEAHAIEKERMRIAQDMHDEIGGKLSRISFLSDMACQSVPAASEASQQIDQVSETAREVIRTVDEIVWAVSPRNDTLDSAIHYICRHAEEFFELTPIELELQLPSEVPPCRLSADVRHNLFCAVKEALHNVLKHAKASRVRITIEVHPSKLAVTINDDGQGFETADIFKASGNGKPAMHTGDGLLNMRERLEAVSGGCVIESAQGQGTTVAFSIPLPPNPKSQIANRKFP